MRKSISKLLSLSLVALLTLSLAACSGAGKATSKDAPKEASSAAANETSKEKFPTRPINIIVCYAAGGGSDLGVRALAPFVEKELGVPVTVVNKPGAGGWLGWLDLLNSKPDGYTIAQINTPSLVTCYLDPKQNTKENLESFQPLANQVTDAGIIAIRNDEKRFTNMKELVEYAKKNDLTTTGTGIAGDDHIAALKLNKKYGTKFEAVQGKGVADSIAAVLGGHVDVLVANVGEVATLHANKEIKVIGVMSDKRSEFLPDVPTLKESGFEGVTSASARGFATKKGVDADKLKILSDAFEKAIKNPDHIKKMKEMGLQVDYKDKDTLYKSIKAEETDILGIKDMLGWK